MKAKQKYAKQLTALRNKNIAKVGAVTHRYGKYTGKSKKAVMSKKDKDIALFVVFCIEEYGAAKGMRGEQVVNLFSQYEVTNYLSKCFEPLHTQGRQWLIEEIDEFIALRK